MLYFYGIGHVHNSVNGQYQEESFINKECSDCNASDGIGHFLSLN
jgi:hypothetical protein